jgi:hypothetical protein
MQKGKLGNLEVPAIGLGGRSMGFGCGPAGMRWMILSNELQRECVTFGELPAHFPSRNDSTAFR